MTEQSIRIPTRFRGPAQSGNGGYSSGVLADFVAGPCQVTLRAPPPLERALRVERAQDGSVALRDGERLVAEAAALQIERSLPDPVSWAEAERAALEYPGFRSHPYPLCFVCGPERAQGDGLRIFPGPVARAEQQLVAAPWAPAPDLCDAQDRVLPRFVWAALDCPSWFGFAAFAERAPPILLGRLASAIVRPPQREERCVVVGWHNGSEGRRIGCGSALFTDSGECLAYARSTWVILKQEPGN